MNSQETTLKWLSRAAEGDRWALQKLIMLHHGRLKVLATKRMPVQLRARFDPDDLLQEVYADAIKRIGQFECRSPEEFFAWLVRILDSRLIDARRHARAKARDVGREAAPPDRLSAYAGLIEQHFRDSVTPSRVIARREADGVLHAALAGLSEDHRTVLELRFLRGMPLIEVAEAMGRSPAAAQMLCARALINLRQALKSLSRSDLR